MRKTIRIGLEEKMKRWLQWLTAVSLVLTLPGSANSMDVAKTGALAGKVVVTKGKKDQNMVAYLKGITGTFPPLQKPALMDQKSKVFLPHLLPVQKAQKLQFQNSDPLNHNVHVYWGGRSMLNVAQPPHSITDFTPPRAGEYAVLCNIHPEMSAFLLVLDHPFFAEVTSNEFKIENIPEGTYTVAVVQDVNAKLKEQERQVTIKAGETTQVTIQY